MMPRKSAASFVISSKVISRAKRPLQKPLQMLNGTKALERCTRAGHALNQLPRALFKN